MLIVSVIGAVEKGGLAHETSTGVLIQLGSSTIVQSW